MAWGWINYYRILIEIGLNTQKKVHSNVLTFSIIVLQIIFNTYIMIIHFNNNRCALMDPVIF